MRYGDYRTMGLSTASPISRLDHLLQCRRPAQPLEENYRQELLASPGHVLRAVGEMLGYYFRFYESLFGRACSAMHDPRLVVIIGARRIKNPPHKKEDNVDSRYGKMKVQASLRITAARAKRIRDIQQPWHYMGALEVNDRGAGTGSSFSTNRASLCIPVPDI